MTDEGNPASVMHKCEAQTKTTLKLTCTNMVLLDGSTCITSLLINFATIDSDQSLRSFLSQWDRKVVAVAADDKCLFRAISHLLFHYNSIVSIHTGVLHVSPPQLTGNIIYHSQVIE